MGEQITLGKEAERHTHLQEVTHCGDCPFTERTTLLHCKLDTRVKTWGFLLMQKPEFQVRKNDDGTETSGCVPVGCPLHAANTLVSLVRPR